MDYIELSLKLNDKRTSDIFEAELADIGFESFMNEGDWLRAYTPSNQWNQGLLDPILAQYKHLFESSATKNIPHTNWNAVWESSYEPAFIDNAIYIKAAFHPDNHTAETSILLEPNMSFGTGHHPTTHMMLRAMRTFNLSGKHIMDFGSGSGILAIYAAKKGAAGVAIEIDAHAADAARANLLLNQVTSFEVITGDIHAWKGKGYDMILANINRNVIEDAAPTFAQNLAIGGLLLCAGFLNDDAHDLIRLLQNHSFTLHHQDSLNGWTMLALEKLP